MKQALLFISLMLGLTVSLQGVGVCCASVGGALASQDAVEKQTEKADASAELGLEAAKAKFADGAVCPAGAAMIEARKQASVAAEASGGECSDGDDGCCKKASGSEAAAAETSEADCCEVADDKAACGDDCSGEVAADVETEASGSSAQS